MLKCLAIARNGVYLASGGFDGTVKVHMQRMVRTTRLVDHKLGEELCSIDFGKGSPGVRAEALAFMEQQVTLVEPTTGTTVGRERVNPRRIVVGGTGGRVGLFNCCLCEPCLHRNALGEKQWDGQCYFLYRTEQTTVCMHCVAFPYVSAGHTHTLPFTQHHHHH